MSELPSPVSMARASRAVTEDQVAQTIPCGPELDQHVAAVRKYIDSGFTHIAVTQVGGDSQGAFLDFAEKELLPALRA